MQQTKTPGKRQKSIYGYFHLKLLQLPEHTQQQLQQQHQQQQQQQQQEQQQ